MPEELSSDFKETVRAHTDIVSLIGETVRLQSVRGGREFIGLCPFHDDNNPSLRVYPDRQSYRCWSCNAGGDCFTFVMESDSVEFREALEVLATRAGVPIPKRSGRPTPPGQEKTTLLEALLWAEGLFHHTLLNDETAAPARAYLAERGFTAQTIETFKLGFHPNDWEWLHKRAQGRFTSGQLVAAGLCGKREGDGGCFDYFVDRVLFPIHNERGQPVGFGGRVLPGADASFGKYFNSNENPVFHKSRLVYALDRARDGLKATDTAVVTEGYTDCITAHQAGLTNVVATLGTALTEMQVTTIKRFARKVVLVYDGDQAGQDAAARAVGRFLAQDVDLRILTLPDGADPAEYISEHGPEAFERKVAGAPEAFDYMFEVLKGRYGLDSLDSRQRILDGVLGVMAGVPKLARHIREDLLLRRVSQRLGIAEEVVRQQYTQARQGNLRRATPAHNTPAESTQTPAHIQRILKGQPTREDRLECEIIQCMLALPDLIPIVQERIGISEFENPALLRLAESLFDLFEAEGAQNLFTRLLSQLDDSASLKQLVVMLEERANHQIRCQLDRLATKGDLCNPTTFVEVTINKLKEWRSEKQNKQNVLEHLSTSECEDAFETIRQISNALKDIHKVKPTSEPPKVYRKAN